MKLVNEERNTFDWKNNLTFTSIFTLFNAYHVIAITVPHCSIKFPYTQLKRSKIFHISCVKLIYYVSFLI